MKEIYSEPGGRPLYNDDVLLLQTELSAAIAAQVRAFGSAMVVQGCEQSAGVTSGNKNIAAGLVYLDGRFQRVDGVSDVALPVYVVSAPVADTNRTYKTGTVKPALKEYKAQIVTVLPTSGQFITINSNQSQYYYYIVRAAALPVGSIQMTDDVSDFDTVTGLGSGGWIGWALCDGQNGTPDMKGRFVVGFDASSASVPVSQLGQSRNYGAVKNTGGQDGVTLGVGQIPAHTHPYQDIYHSEAGGAVSVPSNRGSGDTDGDNAGYQINRITASEGGGLSHENRPPYIVLAYVKKIA